MPDYAQLLAAIDFTPLVVALTGVAVLKLGPGVARWGFNKIVGWFR